MLSFMSRWPENCNACNVLKHRYRQKVQLRMYFGFSWNLTRAMKHNRHISSVIHVTQRRMIKLFHNNFNFFIVWLSNRFLKRVGEFIINSIRKFWWLSDIKKIIITLFSLLSELHSFSLLTFKNKIMPTSMNNGIQYDLRSFNS